MPECIGAQRTYHLAESGQGLIDAVHFLDVVLEHPPLLVELFRTCQVAESHLGPLQHPSLVGLISLDQQLKN